MRPLRPLLLAVPVVAGGALAAQSGSYGPTYAEPAPPPPVAYVPPPVVTYARPAPVYAVPRIYAVPRPYAGPPVYTGWDD